MIMEIVWQLGRKTKKATLYTVGELMDFMNDLVMTSEMGKKVRVLRIFRLT